MSTTADSLYLRRRIGNAMRCRLLRHRAVRPVLAGLDPVDPASQGLAGINLDLFTR
jgi:hypothetical protein